jgi:hypothetical protein
MVCKCQMNQMVICYVNFYIFTLFLVALKELILTEHHNLVYPISIAVRRPCRLMLHGLLRVFPVLRRPGRARTPAGQARPRLRQRHALTASQALSNAAYRQAFIARPPPHPSHSYACEGPEARKTLRGPRRSKGSRTRTSFGSMLELVLVYAADASPRKAEGFFGLPLCTRSCARGVEVAGVKNAAESAFFRACKGGSTSDACWADEGASPSPDTVTPEKPGVARAAKQARASHRD